MGWLISQDGGGCGACLCSGGWVYLAELLCLAHSCLSAFHSLVLPTVTRQLCLLFLAKACPFSKTISNSRPWSLQPTETRLSSQSWRFPPLPASIQHAASMRPGARGKALGCKEPGCSRRCRQIGFYFPPITRRCLLVGFRIHISRTLLIFLTHLLFLLLDVHVGLRQPPAFEAGKEKRKTCPMKLPFPGKSVFPRTPTRV